ncbi:MAG TPA: hypothetical protein DDX85_05540 [Nitrospiraceae bacterium]|nr:hypothetical protein [Nitrospiraceae bacterium]
MLSISHVVSVASAMGRHSPCSEQGVCVEGVKRTGPDDDDRQGPAFDNTINSRAAVKRISCGMDVPLSSADHMHDLLTIIPHDGETSTERPPGTVVIMVMLFGFFSFAAKAIPVSGEVKQQGN